jgi:hypothetical protein
MSARRLSFERWGPITANPEITLCATAIRSICRKGNFRIGHDPTTIIGSAVSLTKVRPRIQSHGLNAAVCVGLAVLLFSIGAGGQRTSQGSDLSTVKLSADALVLHSYIAFEQAQDYQRIYPLLSANRRHYFSRFGVTTAAQYAALRDSSDAHWTEFVIDHRTDEAARGILYSGHALVEFTTVFCRLSTSTR